MVAGEYCRPLRRDGWTARRGALGVPGRVSRRLPSTSRSPRGSRHLDWAINGAIIAGNPPERRVEKLRAFWELVTERISVKPFSEGDHARSFFNEWSALASMAAGIPGFSKPRMPPAWLQPWGTEGALSFYDTTPLRATLEAFVDFDLVNAKDGSAPRLSVGAANIRKGNPAHFDTTERRIGPEHIMASAALPPGLPPVEGRREHTGRGVSQHAPTSARRERDQLLVFSGLFSARAHAAQPARRYERHKDIPIRRARGEHTALGEAQCAARVERCDGYAQDRAARNT